MDQDRLEIRRFEDVLNFINRSEHRRRKGGLYVVLLALGGIFTDAYDFTSLGIGAVQLRQQFALSPMMLGTLTAMMAVGALVGGLFGGYYTDRLGRFKMFFVNMLLFVVATLVAAFAPNYSVLLIARFFMGIGVGLDFPVAMAFIAEYNTVDRKGGLINLWQATWYVAGSICFILALLMYSLGAGDHLWRWAVGFGAVPAALVLVLRYFLMDESPLWEAARGNLAAAAKILEATYHVRTTVDPAAQAQFVEQRDHAHSLALYRLIFSPRYRLRTVQAVVISTMQSFEYYAVGFYLPTIALLIFGADFVTAILGSLVFNLFGVLGGGLQAWLTQSWGIRRLAMTGCSLVIAMLLILGLFGQHFPPLLGGVCLALFIFGHSFGIGSQGLTLASLSYPTVIRGAASGFTQAVQRIGSVVGFFFFPILVASIGLYPTLLWLSLVPIIGMIAVVTIKWDPTGKDVDAEYAEIRAMQERQV
ncbi:MAG: MFS transporter [Rhodospirillales bacterium]|nr:MFS transporter [Rhodospirillales bacterium]